jgi:hypothetical protein
MKPTMTIPATPFRVLGYQESPLKHDGTSPKNRWWVSVEVEDKQYKVGIRRESCSIRLPLELRDHPMAKEIKGAAAKIITEVLLSRRMPVAALGQSLSP